MFIHWHLKLMFIEHVDTFFWNELLKPSQEMRTLLAYLQHKKNGMISEVMGDLKHMLK